jgi:hypothetical protein
MQADPGGQADADLARCRPVMGSLAFAPCARTLTSPCIASTRSIARVP